jgi:hypothetical protein
MAVVTFFAALRYNVAPQEEKEGDDNCRRFLRCATNKTNKKEKRKNAYLGPT